MSVTRLLSISLFVLAGLVLAALEVLARREGSKIPTLGALAGFLMGYRAGRLPLGRIAVYAVWWWIGWHFFAR
jgi:hypothetical protein